MQVINAANRNYRLPQKPHLFLFFQKKNYYDVFPSDLCTICHTCRNTIPEAVADFWLKAEKESDALGGYLFYFEGRLDIAVIEEESSPSDHSLVSIIFFKK